MSCDPECPEYRKFVDELFNDPMTEYSGCGGEIVEDFERKHLQHCEHCKNYSVTNIEVV